MNTRRPFARLALAFAVSWLGGCGGSSDAAPPSSDAGQGPGGAAGQGGSSAMSAGGSNGHGGSATSTGGSAGGTTATGGGAGMAAGGSAGSATSGGSGGVTTAGGAAGATTNGGAAGESTAGGAGGAMATGGGGDGGSSGGAGGAGPTLVAHTTKVTLPGAPYGMAFQPANDKAYFGCSVVTNGVTQGVGIAVVDTKTDKVSTTIPVPNDGLVLTIAADGVTGLVFAAVGDSLLVIDSYTDRILSTVKLLAPGAFEPFVDIAVDQVHHQVYVLTSIFGMQGQGHVYVFDEKMNAVVGAPFSVPVQPIDALTNRGGHTLAVDPTTRSLFVLGGDSSFHGVGVTLDATTGMVTGMNATTGNIGRGSGVVAIGGGNAIGTLLSNTGKGSLFTFDPEQFSLPDDFVVTGISSMRINSPTSAPHVRVILTGFDPTTGKCRTWLVNFFKDSGGLVSSAREVFDDQITNPGEICLAVTAAESPADGTDFLVELGPDPTSMDQTLEPIVVHFGFVEPSCKLPEDCDGNALDDAAACGANGACGGCNSDADCPMPLHCDATSRQCVDCEITTDCPDLEVCIARLCTASDCKQDSDCPTGQICPKGVCLAVFCVTDSDCNGVSETCDQVSETCR